MLLGASKNLAMDASGKEIPIPLINIGPISDSGE
jgi:hypothetical protein